jgi:YVTN family beta-propeller protein
VASPFVAFGLFGVDVSPAGDRVYVASEDNNALYTVNTATNAASGSVTVNDGPAAFGRFITAGGGVSCDTDELEAALTAAQASLVSCQADLGTASARYSQCQADLGARDTTILNLSGQVTDLTGQISGLKSQITTLNAQITSLNGQIATLTSDKNALQAQVDTLTAQKNTLQGQLNTLTAANTALQGQVNTLTAKNATLTAENQYLSAQLANSAATIDALLLDLFGGKATALVAQAARNMAAAELIAARAATSPNDPKLKQLQKAFDAAAADLSAGRYQQAVRAFREVYKTAERMLKP